MAQQATKIERIAARLTPEQKMVLQRAADLSGRTLTDFIISAAMADANEVIETHHVITLSARDSLLFAEAILNPGEPGPALKKAMKRRRELIAD